MIRIEYDDDTLVVLEKVNAALAEHGLQVRDDDIIHDGFSILNVVRTADVAPAQWADSAAWEAALPAHTMDLMPASDVDLTRFGVNGAVSLHASAVLAAIAATPKTVAGMPARFVDHVQSLRALGLIEDAKVDLQQPGLRITDLGRTVFDGLMKEAMGAKNDLPIFDGKGPVTARQCVLLEAFVDEGNELGTNIPEPIMALIDDLCAKGFAERATVNGQPGVKITESGKKIREVVRQSLPEQAQSESAGAGA